MADLSQSAAALGHQFLLAWIPLFVAMDPPGLVPMFLGLTEGLTPQERRSVAAQASITAGVVSLFFMLLGRLIFDALGITFADFQVAGGLIFLLLAVRDMLELQETKVMQRRDLGVVPLGTPLIAGPATLVALLVLVGSIGPWLTVTAFLLNLALVWLAFRQSHWLVRVIGLRGLRAFSKIVALVLAAFAVSMIRRGWQAM